MQYGERSNGETARVQRCGLYRRGARGVGGEGLRLYFTDEGLCLLWLAMATIMCGSLALNAGGEMYKLEASSHFSDLYSLETASVSFPGAEPPADGQAWRSLRRDYPRCYHSLAVNLLARNRTGWAQAPSAGEPRLHLRLSSLDKKSQRFAVYASLALCHTQMMWRLSC